MSSDKHTSKIAGCSVKGPKHEEENKPCQDAWDGTQVSTSQFILAVADGLGSAKQSQFGAKIATETAVNKLNKSIKEKNITEERAKKEIKSAFKRARSAINEEASNRGVPNKALNTTLLVAIGGPSGIGAAAVGDGGVVCAHQDEFQLLVPRESSAHANQTTPLQSDRWQDNYRFAYLRDADSVAVFSDGLDNFAWENRDTPQDALFEQFFELIRSEFDKEYIAEQLSDFLNHERYRSVSGDDKTIALATVENDASENDFVGTKTTPASDKQMVDDTGSSDRPGKTDPVNSPDTDNKPFEVNGEMVVATEKIASDSVSDVYTTLSKKYPQIRLYQDKFCTKKNRNKIEHMKEKTIDNGDPDVMIQWPAGVLTDVHSNTFRGCAFSNEGFNRGVEFDKFTTHKDTTSMWSYISLNIGIIRKGVGPNVRQEETATRLASAIATLHESHAAVCEFESDRIRATNSAVILRGADLFAFNQNTYHSPISKDNTNSIINEKITSFQEAKWVDRFKLAVCLYQVLTDGYSPFESTEGLEKSDSELKPHINNKKDKHNQSVEEQQYMQLPGIIRYHFEKCFSRGLENPKKRPEASEWEKILKDYC